MDEQTNEMVAGIPSPQAVGAVRVLSVGDIAVRRVVLEVVRGDEVETWVQLWADESTCIQNNLVQREALTHDDERRLALGTEVLFVERQEG